MNTTKIACVIPARLQSSRFPKKILALLAGKPLLGWVWEAANNTKMFSNVLFAIDSQETANVIEKFNGKYIMTSQDCASGTDRLIEVMNSKIIDADIWVNWQCDEPFITKKMISCLLRSSEKDGADIWTLKKQIKTDKEINSSNIVKVVCDKNNFALYFSRHSIPFYRTGDIEEEKQFYKHVGIYAYSKDALQKIASMQKCYLEMAEKLEQLRFLYNGLSIKVHKTNQDTIGIDHLEDLKKAEKYIKNNNLLSNIN